MNKNTERTRLIWIVLIALIIGVLTGYIWQVLLLTLIAYIVWILSSLSELEDWLYKGSDIDKTPYIFGVCGTIVTNIVKLKNQQKKSTKSYQTLMVRFNEVLRSFPYPTIVLNTNSEMQWISKNAAKILGLNRKKDVGIRISNIFRNADFKTLLSQPDLSEFQMQSPSDEHKILAVAISKLSKDTRILSIRDVSDRRKLEKLRKTFIANASHELRTPLTVINGYLEMLEKHNELPEEVKHMVVNAYQHSKRMNVLISDLLMLSSLENSETQTSKPVLIPMHNLIAEVLDNINNTSYSEHRIKTTVNDKLMIHGFYSQIYSIVFNLLENALKYSEDNVALNWQLSDNLALLQVIDQGIGLDEEDKVRLTEPFYRSKKAQCNQIQGTGLGLSIVNQAVINNKGQFNVADNETKGTIFNISFDQYQLND